MKNLNAKIVFNTSGNNETGSSRIFFHNVYKKLKQRGFPVSLNDLDNYRDFIVAILYGPDHELKRAKKINPDLIVGLSKLSDLTKEDIYQLRNSDFLIAETNLQRDYYLRYNKNIVTLPLVEDIPPKLFKKSHPNKDKIILGYHGNKAHLEESIACGMEKALEELHRKYDIEMLAIYNIKGLGKWEKNVPKIPIIHKQISLNSIYHDLLTCDIGLCPSLAPVFKPDICQNLFFRFMKFREYGNRSDFIVRYKNSSNAGRAFVFMSLGIPVVAEPVPQNCEVITNGINGFVVHTKESWCDALEKLILDNKLRERIARNAKKFVSDNGYTIDSMIDKFIEGIRFYVRQKQLFYKRRLHL